MLSSAENALSVTEHAAQQSLAADGAIAYFSNSLVPRELDADRAPQLKASVRQHLVFAEGM